MDFQELKKYTFKVFDKQTDIDLSSDEEFFLDKDMNLFIKDVMKDGTVKINKANLDLYNIVIEKNNINCLIDFVNRYLGTKYDEHTEVAVFATAALRVLAQITFNSINGSYKDLSNIKFQNKDITVNHLNNRDKEILQDLFIWCMKNPY